MVEKYGEPFENLSKTCKLLDYENIKKIRGKKRMFIVITGLDGSGTSTVAEQFHKIDKESFLFHTPDEVYERKSIDSAVRDVSQWAHYLYYLSSVVYLSDYVRKNIDYKKHNVYCVRYLIDTVVSHRVAGLNVDMDYERYGIIRPDLTIFVQLDEKKRQDRIKSRGKSLLDSCLDDESTRNAFLCEFEKQLTNKIIFNNENENISLQVEEIYYKILKRKEGKG